MSSLNTHELSIPEDVVGSAASTELGRLWFIDGRNYYVLNVSPFADQPEAWGMFAVDLMKHAARAYEQLDGRDAEATYKLILAGLLMEMQNPTESL